MLSIIFQLSTEFRWKKLVLLTNSIIYLKSICPHDQLMFHWWILFYRWMLLVDFFYSRNRFAGREFELFSNHHIALKFKSGRPTFPDNTLNLELHVDVELRQRWVCNIGISSLQVLCVHEQHSRKRVRYPGSRGNPKPEAVCSTCLTVYLAHYSQRRPRFLIRLYHQ